MKTNIWKIICIIFILNTFSAFSQWEQCNGPFGGHISDIGFSQNKIFAASQMDGVYRSSDGGENWLYMGLSGYDINRMIVKDSIIAVGSQWGITLSMDFGVTWNTPGAGGNMNISCITVFDNYIICGKWEDGLLFSSNFGVTWEIKNTPNKYVSSIMIYDGALFIGTNKGLFTSYDEGDTWLDSTLQDLYVFDIINDGNYFYTRTSDGILVSNDKGISYKKKDNLLSAKEISHLLISDGKLYAVSGNDIFQSTDKGDTWNLYGKFGSDFNCLAINDKTLFAGGSIGIYLSSDKGTTWQPKGIKNLWVTDLKVKNNKLFAGTWDGVYISSDFGNSWTDDNRLMAYPVNCLAFNDNNIWAGTYVFGVHFSTDDGKTWKTKNNGLTDLDIYSIAFKDSLVVASTYDDGVFFSTNNGDSWAPKNSGLPDLGMPYVYNEVCSIVCMDSIIFGATHFGVYISTNNGENWIPKNKSIENIEANTLFLSGRNIYAGTDKGLYISKNYGEEWNLIGLSNHGINKITIYDTIIFVSTYDEVFLSTNNGIDWNNINNGITEINITSLVVLDDYIFAGTYGSSVFRAKISDLITSTEEQNHFDNILNIAPNPVQDITTISFNIENTNFVTIQIMDIFGNVVAKLIDNKFREEGKHDIYFVTKDLPAGVYFCIVKYADVVETKNIIVMN